MTHFSSMRINKLYVCSNHCPLLSVKGLVVCINVISRDARYWILADIRYFQKKIGRCRYRYIYKYILIYLNFNFTEEKSMYLFCTDSTINVLFYKCRQTFTSEKQVNYFTWRISVWLIGRNIHIGRYR